MGLLEQVSAEQLLLLASVFVSLGAAGLLRAAFAASDCLLALMRKKGRTAELSGRLSFVRWPVSANFFRFAQLLLWALGCGMLFLEPWGGVLLVFLSWLPSPLLQRACDKRRERLELQVEAWLASLARALDASPSLGEAIEVSASLCDAPLSEELKVVLAEMALGRPLELALSSWSERVESRVLTLSLAILHVGRRTGGKLGEVLKTGAEALREMARLEGVLRTKTAEGRAQAWVVSIVPFPLCCLVNASDPEYFLPLETTSTGHVLVLTSGLLWLAAIFLSRKILAVQI